MFVSAVSTKGPDNVKPDDLALGNSVGDLTPATFRVEFDEPIRIKNCDFELVASKITKRNEIIINAGNNTFTFRLGTHVVAEQYTAKIPHGNYTDQQLADAIQFAINEVVPCNIYKNFTVSLSTGFIKVTYTLAAPPTPEPFQTHALNDDNSFERGCIYNKTAEDGAGTNKWVKYECTDAQKDQNRSAIQIPADEWEFCGPMAGGTTEPDTFQRTAIDTFGIWETQRGEVEAILRPKRCIVKSTYDTGFGGFGGATGKPTYLTFEFERNVDELGNEVTGLYRFGGMFNANTLKFNQPRKYKSTSNRRFINGVLNLATAGVDKRGPPYNVRHQMVFPTSVDPINGNNTHNRRANYTTGWEGCITMKREVGRPGQIPNIPKNYSFQMDLQGTGEKASCLAKRVGFKTDRVRIRTSKFPLIKGLPQQQVLNGPQVDTFCTISNPINGVPATRTLKYIVNSVGELNNFDFGQNTLIGNIQSLVPTDPSQARNPYYKILTITPAGAPQRVRLCDGGEYVIEIDTTSPATRLATSFFLNDPNTFTYNVSDDEDTLMEDEICRIEPLSADIGVNAFVEQDQDYRYLSFNMGLMRDNIFQLCKQPTPAVPYANPDQPLSVPKDIEIDITSKLFTTGGAVDPNPSGTGNIEVTINQLQPSTDKDEDNVIRNTQTDVKRLLLNASSGSWSSSAGSGGAMANWSTFVGVNNANGAVKVSIVNKDTYTEMIMISHCTNYTDVDSLFVQSVMLTATNTQRGGQGTPAKNACTRKTRFFPLHPVYSIMPTTIVEKNEVFTQCVGSEYPLRNTFYSIDGKSNFLNNYEANLAFMTPGQFNAPQNIFPDPAPLGARCVMMIKTKRLDINQISPGPAPPAAGSTGLCIPEDFTPSDAASFYNADMHSVMYAQITGIATSVDFPLNRAPKKQPFISSYAVEIQNLPQLKGYVGKGFDEGQLSQRRGLGSALPIVGIVPATEFPESSDLIVNYHYKVPYSQPVQVRLPTATFLYNLDINLRNLVTGRLLTDLLHSSEVILRIYPYPD